MMKQEIGEIQEDYYSRLLGRLLEHGNKAFTEENADTIDKMIKNQFMVKNDEKTRKYLIKKGSKTAKGALSLTISSEAANSFDEILKDTAGTIATADINNKNKSKSKAERHEPIEKQWNRRSRSSLRDSYVVRSRSVSFIGDRPRPLNSNRYQDRSQERHFSGPCERDGHAHKGSRERYQPSSHNRYDSDHQEKTRYSPNPRNQFDDRKRSRECNWDRCSPRQKNNYEKENRDRSSQSYRSNTQQHDVNDNSRRNYNKNSSGEKRKKFHN